MPDHPAQPESIFTQRAVTPHGHYSQAIKAGDFLFVSGILGTNEDYMPGNEPSVETQTLKCLEQIDAIVCAAGGGRESIVKVGVFLRDAGLWPHVNDVYSHFFGGSRPARIVVPCGPMRFNSAVEMDAIAYIHQMKQ